MYIEGKGETKKEFKNTFKKPLTFTLLNGIMYIEGKGETKKKLKRI